MWIVFQYVIGDIFIPHAIQTIGGTYYKQAVRPTLLGILNTDLRDLIESLGIFYETLSVKEWSMPASLRAPNNG